MDAGESPFQKRNTNQEASDELVKEVSQDLRQKIVKTVNQVIIPVMLNQSARVLVKEPQTNTNKIPMTTKIIQGVAQEMSKTLSQIFQATEIITEGNSYFIPHFKANLHFIVLWKRVVFALIKMIRLMLQYSEYCNVRMISVEIGLSKTLTTRAAVYSMFSNYLLVNNV